MNDLPDVSATENIPETVDLGNPPPWDSEHVVSDEETLETLKACDEETEAGGKEDEPKASPTPAAEPKVDEEARSRSPMRDYRDRAHVPGSRRVRKDPVYPELENTVTADEAEEALTNLGEQEEQLAVEQADEVCDTPPPVHTPLERPMGFSGSTIDKRIED